MSGYKLRYRCEVCGEGCHTIHRADGSPVATRIVLVDGVGQPPVPHAYHDNEYLDEFYGGHDAVPVPEPVGDAIRHAIERYRGSRRTATGTKIVDVDAGDRL